MRISRESTKATGEYIRHTTVRTQPLIFIVKFRTESGDLRGVRIRSPIRHLLSWQAQWSDPAGLIEV